MSLAVVTGVFGLLILLYLVQANKSKERQIAEREGEKVATGEDDWYIQGDRHPDFKYTY